MGIKKIFFIVFLILIVVSCLYGANSSEGKEAGKVEEKELAIVNEAEKKFLLELARNTIDEYLKSGCKPKIDEKELTQTMKREYGCFVTLNLNGKLRGCIGYLQPIKPLYIAIMENAINAAACDPRFRAVKYEELKDIKIEISILSSLQDLEFDSPNDLLNKLVPLRDGVVLKIGMSSATFLPQVWETLPNKIDFLSQLSLKSGNMPDAWKGKNVEVYTYFADVFSE
ncbi:MAG: AmmeMemoRadiSam system protein A [bacterium]